MDESKEELEPLFDYSRVQPIDFAYIDDDDCSDSEKPSTFSPKRMKKSDPPNCKVEIVSDCHKKVEEEEDDWLAPPPKIFNDARKVEHEDSMLKELRLKKQELASLAQSAEDVLRAVEESAKREVGTQSSLESEADQPSQTRDNRVKIIISIQDKDGLKQFRMYTDETLDRLFKMYATKVKQDVQNLVFCFDGDKVCSAATPGGLGMEDNDIIEVHIK